MQPVYNEFIEFLEAKTGQNLNIKEGMYWSDNHNILFFTPDGEKHIVYRYKVDQKLNVTIKKLPCDSNEDIESWDKTLIRLSDYINRLSGEAEIRIKNCFYLPSIALTLVLSSHDGNSVSSLSYVISSIVFTGKKSALST